MLPQKMTIYTTPQSYRFKIDERANILGTNVNVNEFYMSFIEIDEDNFGNQFARAKYRWYDRDTGMLYIPYYDLNRFINFIESRGLNYEIERLSLQKGVAVEIPLKPHAKPRTELQIKSAAYITEVNKTEDKHVRGLGMQTGTGKMNSIHSRIKVPGGWSTMGDLKVGDYVTAWDGTKTVVTGVYPHKDKQLYKVTFWDGRWTLVGAEHLWQSFYVNTQPNCRWRVRDTLELKRLISMPNPRVYVPLSTPEKTPDLDLPIDPYTLGYLIGNGNYTHGSLNVTTIDTFVIEQIRQSLPEDLKIELTRKITYGITIKDSLYPRHIRHLYRKSMRDLGMWGCRAWEKTIPKLYMNSSVDQKWALIQGLMDSDGTADKCGSSSFCTTSPKLALQIQYLIRELGGIASIKETTKYYTLRGEKKQGRLAFNVKLRVKKPSLLFRLPRKKDRVSDTNQYAEELKLRVKSIEPHSVGDAVCISVDHPDRLYVCDDFIVTHNTFTAIYTIAQMGIRSIVCLPFLIEQWKDEILEFTDLKSEDIYIIQGMQSAAKLLKGIDRTIHPKIILASTPTLRSWLTRRDSFMNFPPIQEMMDRLKIGVRFTDENHLNFQVNLMLDLVFNTNFTVPMTATFEHNSPVGKRIFDQHYPKRIRFGDDEYKQYVDIYSFGYRMDVSDVPSRVYHNGKKYNHAKFETWLLTKDKDQNHLKHIFSTVICPIARGLYYNVKNPGERLLVLCASVAMCEWMKEQLEKEFPDYTYAVYTGDDGSEVYENADVVISTPNKSGTGRNIKNIRAMIMTITVSSSPSNKQYLGRLRELANQITPSFAFIWCIGIPKQVKSAEEKEIMFRPLAKNFYSYTL